MNLSVVIITKNEEKNISKAVCSASFADEVLVLDSGSIDKTCDLAKGLGARVEYQEWLGFGRQKNKAVEMARNDWVFVLDADEQITLELEQEIISTLKNPLANGYYIARLNNFFGKNIKTSGLYPDRTIRLFDKKKGAFDDAPVHESIIIQGKVSKLKNHMNHLAYESIEEFISKQNSYSSLNLKNNNIFKALFSPSWTFFKMYILRLGFLDGKQGYIIAKLYSQYTFWKYIK